MRRSRLWKSFEKRYLLKHNTCAACGNKARPGIRILVGHHIIPFSVDPTRELDETNLIALCDGRLFRRNKCHYLVGHNSNFRAYNTNVVADAAALLMVARAVKNLD